MRRFTIVIALLFFVGVFSLHAQDTPLPFDIITAENADRVEQVSVIEGQQPIIQVAWSPDGNYIAVIQGSDSYFVEIWHVEIEGGDIELTLHTRIEPDFVQYIDWMPDGQSLVTYSKQPFANTSDLLVQRWQIDGELQETLLQEVVAPPNCCDPFVHSIVGWTGDYGIYAELLDNFTVRFSDEREFTYLLPESLLSNNFITMPNFGSIIGLLWGPNNDYFAVFKADGTPSFNFQIVDFATLEIIHYVEGQDYFICNAWWSPDETTLAVASERVSIGSGHSTAVVFYRLDEPVVYGDGERRLWFDENYGTICTAALDWSRDSSIAMIGTDSGIQLYDVETLSQISVISQDPTSALSLHPSGRLLVTGDANGSLRIWGIPSDEE